MPYKPKRPCNYPACPELTDSRYCDKHKKLTDSEYNRFQRDLDTAKRYGQEWRHIRKQYIQDHPLCEECEKQGRLIPAQEVHHIRPLKKGGTHDTSNLMSLCTACHSAISARDGDRWGR